MHGFKEILPFCVVEISCAKLPFLQELELLAVPKGEGQQTGELDLYFTYKTFFFKCRFVYFPF